MGFDPSLAISDKSPDSTYFYTKIGEAFYALGIGVCASDAVDKEELKYVYHENSQKAIKVLPTFVALLTLESLPSGFDLPGLQYDPRLMLYNIRWRKLSLGGGILRLERFTRGSHEEREITFEERRRSSRSDQIFKRQQKKAKKGLVCGVYKGEKVLAE
ncbi:hypothetical protein RYX36_027085 [Vicia faba]